MKERHADKREGCACVSEGEGARAKQQLAANVLHIGRPSGQQQQSKQSKAVGKVSSRKK